MNGNGFWISIDNLEILGNWRMEMFSISNILLLFATFFEFFGRVKERVDFGNTIFIVYLSKLLDCWVFVYYLFFERMKRIGAFWNFGDIYIALYLGIWIFLDLFFRCCDFSRGWKGLERILWIYTRLLLYVFRRWRDWILWIFSRYFVKGRFN